MYLYEKKDNKINVYELTPKEKLIEEYKRQEIRQIPVTKRVYTAKSNLSRQELPLFNPEGTVHLSDIEYDYEFLLIFREFHLIKKYRNLDKAESVLEDYYKNNNRKYNENCVVVDADNKYIYNYYLLTQSYRQYYPYIQIMNGIINVPVSLYILDNIQLGNGNRLKKLDISEQKELFNFSKVPIESFSLDDINKLEAFGVVNQKLTKSLLENNQQLIKKLIRK